MIFLCFIEAIRSRKCVTKARVKPRQIRVTAVQELILVCSEVLSKVFKSTAKETHTQMRLTSLGCEATMDIIESGQNTRVCDVVLLNH